MKLLVPTLGWLSVILTGVSVGIIMGAYENVTNPYWLGIIHGSATVGSFVIFKKLVK